MDDLINDLKMDEAQKAAFKKLEDSGYPGALKEPGTNELVWPFQSFTWKVTDVTETNIVLHVDFPNLYWPGHEEEKINEVLGGVSGGPVFRIIEIPERTQMRFRFELVGIVYEVMNPFRSCALDTSGRSGRMAH
jgi:hypothetical protein